VTQNIKKSAPEPLGLVSKTSDLFGSRNGIETGHGVLATPFLFQTILTPAVLEQHAGSTSKFEPFFYMSCPVECLIPSRSRRSTGFERISPVLAWSSEIIAAALEEIIFRTAE